MAIVARLWVAGELVNAAKMNTIMSDLTELEGRLGSVSGVDSIIAKLIAPVYTTNGTPEFTPRPVDGDDIRDNETTHYTMPAGSHRAILHSVVLCNTSPQDRSVEVHIVPSGSNRASSTAIFDDTIFAGETIEIGGPFFLDNGDSLRSIGVGLSANEVALLATVTEVSAQIAGVGLVVTDGVTAAAAAALIYTCPNGQHAYLANLVLTNTHASDATSVYVEVRPSGGGQQNRQRIVSTSLLAGEQLSVSGVLLEPGDGLYLHASTAGLIAVRPTVIEYEGV